MTPNFRNSKFLNPNEPDIIEECCHPLAYPSISGLSGLSYDPNPQNYF